MRLGQLLDHTGLDVLDHLEREVAVPVIDGPQAQGDLIVLPAVELAYVKPWRESGWSQVPPEGVDLIRGGNGANPHTLVGDPGTCRFTWEVRDSLGLALALLENTAPVYLIHPEHGGTGIAPGRWVVRRQQERGRPRRGSGFTWGDGLSPNFVVD
ncbi:hypothetical protein V5P93_004344 [Actinokineospora auranticolor]|uniref:Uncharacterized protein n=1 Tax=Actinokineospora auranticolor TaxID=155976 RepID=A0A2S6GTG9_9PSEU|nr:hypothetical protein [Actinokineospora auranticolor]PPK68548.1 hypothetical protein CLV40_105277 [Actinokineospora auranticolor]